MASLRRFVCVRDRAGNGTRTRDPNLGKVVLYQLSYSRLKSEYKQRGAFGEMGLANFARLRRWQIRGCTRTTARDVDRASVSGLETERVHGEPDGGGEQAGERGVAPVPCRES